MRISKLSFGANFAKEIDAQFQQGLKRYKQDPKALQYYQERMKEVYETAGDITVSSMPRISPCTGIAGNSIVELKNENGDSFYCKWKNPEIRYEQVVKTPNLVTLDGITALCQNLSLVTKQGKE